MPRTYRYPEPAPREFLARYGVRPGRTIESDQRSPDERGWRASDIIVYDRDDVHQDCLRKIAYADWRRREAIMNTDQYWSLREALCQQRPAHMVWKAMNTIVFQLGTINRAEWHEPLCIALNLEPATSLRDVLRIARVRLGVL